MWKHLLELQIKILLQDKLNLTEVKGYSNRKEGAKNCKWRHKNGPKHRLPLSLPKRD